MNKQSFDQNLPGLLSVVAADWAVCALAPGRWERRQMQAALAAMIAARNKFSRRQGLHCGG